MGLALGLAGGCSVNKTGFLPSFSIRKQIIVPPDESVEVSFTKHSNSMRAEAETIKEKE